MSEKIPDGLQYCIDAPIERDIHILRYRLEVLEVIRDMAKSPELVKLVDETIDKVLDAFAHAE